MKHEKAIEIGNFKSIEEKEITYKHLKQQKRYSPFNTHAKMGQLWERGFGIRVQIKLNMRNFHCKGSQVNCWSSYEPLPCSKKKKISWTG